ncbi:inverse autotransporter beta domain-containing protein [Buttiauxella sp. WJP83]|uniref:inverse autotransporter beta domain-containing protein n=1 Tax=Buttiauxella sp. WJP83 TaxID=2986951 RepID=UPI0022DD4666|nr:inverse autotransporter beta domain-containing protein [Buttiauxella sp. WJP83]WBM72037.1 inverse autotransporter beta domain-containing protein [Buttiauxella sp. WJP83]
MKKIVLYFLIMPSLSMLFTDVSHSANNIALPDLGGSDSSVSEHNSSTASPSSDKSNPVEKKTSEILVNEAQSNFHNLTPEGMKSEALQYGKNLATEAAQSKIEELLSPYGHIATSININDKGNLDGSSLDYLLPWYEGESNLWFSQFSAHNKDGRTIANMGVGVRHNISKDWMLGSNLFYDHDITRGHHRAGLGGEAWTNYLKLSGNYYLPLSSWKDSPDLDDYEERPARGWDLRMQAYLPAYPQLGSSLVYEKYYGDQVALFGTDNLQEDPSAVTVGVDYTPVPLITLQAGYKKGDADTNEATANLSLDYRIGVPLSKQLDGDEVAQMRTLAGSRMDFVDRNNDIVLEYREKNDLDVGLYLKPTGTAAACILADDPDSAEAYEGCHWTVNATVTSHLKLKSAQWVPMGSFNPENTLGLPALTSGNISNGEDNHWTLTFPAWVDSTDPNANKYRLALTLVDDKGHTKQSNAVNIIVTEAPINYQLVIDDNGEAKKAIKLLANGNSFANLVASGAKISGLAGETTPVDAQNLGLTFHAYKMEDKSHSQEVTIHASKSECTSGSECLFYKEPPSGSEAVLGSTMSGVFSVIAEKDDDNTKKTNTVLVDFSPASTMIYTAIVDSENPTVNLTATKGNVLKLGRKYEFKIAYDSNNNGQWDATDRETVSDTNATPLISLVDYKWFFDGTSPNGTQGGYAVNSTINNDISIPDTNAQASQVFVNAGADGIQGFKLKIDYQLTPAGQKIMNNLRAQK